jgi:site-specific recombinase XerC
MAAMGALTAPNAALYRDWQRARAAGGYAPLPRNEYALISLQEHAGGRLLISLGRTDLQEWAASMDTMASSSRASYWSSARAFYNWASSDEEEIIPKSPMRGMRAPKDPRRPVPVPRLDDIATVIAAAERDRTPRGRRDTALLRLLADTGGPRASEAAGLLIYGRPHPAGTPAGLGIDLDHDQVTVIGKGSKIRTFPISAKTASAFARWFRVRDTLPGAAAHPRAWHSFSSRQQPLTYSGVEDIVGRRCDAAGVPRLHPHQWRHFSYHQFLKRGGRLNDAMMLYGWTDDQMPREYAAALAEERAIEVGHSLAIGDQW